MILLSATQAYNGEDYNGARIVSRACELRDAVRGLSFALSYTLEFLMLTVSKCFLCLTLFSYFFQVHGMLSQMDPALVAYCEKIASQGGPVQLSDELGDSTFPATPVVLLGQSTRMSARLRHVQPEVNMNQSYEVLKRTKKIAEVHAGMN